MNIIVLNAGSGSQRCSLFAFGVDAPQAGVPQEAIWEAVIDSTAPNQPKDRVRVMVAKHGSKPTERAQLNRELTPHDRTLELIRLLWEGDSAPLGGPEEIDLVGHRIVHGGRQFEAATPISSEVENSIHRLSTLAPLHNPSGLAGLRAARETLGPRARHFAVFDTAFHRTIPPPASTYAGPYHWVDDGIQRYGFHGTNFRWVAQRAAHLLGRDRDPDLSLILCHLGGGCSLCATRGGRSLATTMGFTPLDGIAMCTRSGAVDPGILIHLQRQGMSADAIEHLLNQESGLKGLSGLSGDTREISAAARMGDSRAQLALDVFIHRAREGMGQMLGALGEAPAAFVFTDAIAEDEPEIRAALCHAFGFAGLRIDVGRNRQAEPDCDFGHTDSSIRALLIKSREAWQIALECAAVARKSP